MRKIILFVLSFLAFVLPCGATTIDQKIDAIVAPASDFLSNKIVFYPINIMGTDVPLIILWLIIGGLVCVIATKGIQQDTCLFLNDVPDLVLSE